MKLAKFGGTSVGSADAIRQLVSIVAHRGQEVVVVSALSGTTDKLIDIARLASKGETAWHEKLGSLSALHFEVLGALAQGADHATTRSHIESLLAELSAILSGIAALRELSPRTLDLVMSFGERMSSVIVAAAFRGSGIDAIAVDARTLIVASGEHGNARSIRNLTEARIHDYLRPRSKTHPLPIVTGFIAASPEGETITLGRGGSDFTAAIIGQALSVEEIEIWTDVDGILTSDPGKVKDAFSLDSLSYEEAMELSHFGAKVIYPPTIQPALDLHIPIRILNTFNPSFPGTLISLNPAKSKYPVRGISSIPRVALFRLQGPGMVGVTGTAMRLFGCLAARSINIVLISQASSERSICFAVSPDDSQKSKLAIEEEFRIEISEGRISPPLAEDDKSIVAVVGERMKHTPGISGRVFYSLGRNGVNVSAIAQGSSEINISAVVDSRDETKACNAVHEAFFLAGTRSVNVIMVGCGLVGGTLLSQIAHHRSILSEDHSIKVNVVGICNSRKMLLRESGIDLASWKIELEEKGEPTDLKSLLVAAKLMSLPNTAIIDCTASDYVPKIYESLLRESFAVVTPNKRGNAGLYSQYETLRNAVRETGTPYLYETTAGAGLPVISTLNDLLVSGDRIIRIEAMLSGTIGFVMSHYDGTSSFASLVRHAKELGYTEPDPRDDLCAADVARKALILSRECGSCFEFGDIHIEPILPESCIKAKSIEDFFVVLEKEEPYFRAMLENAKGRSLVYQATITPGGISLGLKTCEEGMNLYGLKDAENAVAFVTERYSKMPLIVRGPGAGGDVTAGGLFADIIRVAKSLV